MKSPNLKQLAVLDWLRRWPGIFLTERGRWTASWASDAARLHMIAVAGDLGGAVIAGKQEGWGTFGYTPHCGTPTFKVLLAWAWIELVAAARRSDSWQLSEAGRAVLLRHCFRLKGFEPSPSGRSIPRPIAASARLLKRYGGPEAAERHAGFHEMQAAYHARIAARLRESLKLYEGSPEQRTAEWAARAAAKARK